MMQHRVFTLCITIFAGTLAVGRAAVVERDWKNPGDGLLTFDDVNQREWLDLSETILDQFDQGNLEENYQSVLTELDSGGLFEGFSVAIGDDTAALALSAGIDTNSGDFETNKIATAAIIKLLSVTVAFGNEHQRTIGLLAQFATPPPSFCPCREAAIFVVDSDASNPNMTNAQAGFGISDGNDFIRSPYSGVMLYRLAVPEPETEVMCSICILVLLGKYPVLGRKRPCPN